MSQPKSLTTAIWKSLNHCYDTRIAKHVPKLTHDMPVVLKHDETAGTAYQTVDDEGNSVLGFGSSLAKHNETGGSMIEFYKRVLYHEFGHAVETVGMEIHIGDGDHTRGREKLLQDLTENGIPFSLFNLFEDVRLEGLQRRLAYGVSRFNWSKWQQSITQSRSTWNAGACLYEMKLQENGRAAMVELRQWARRFKHQHTFNLIRRNFFNKLVALQTDAATWDTMLQLLKDWVQLFGTDTAGIPVGPTGDDLGIGPGPSPTPDRGPDRDPPPREQTPDPDNYLDPRDIPFGTGNMTIIVRGTYVTGKDGE